MKYSMFSETGSRQENEDSIGVYTERDCQVFFLADGLGGHGSGKEASKCVIEHGIDILKSEYALHPDGKTDIQEYLEQVFLEGHELLKIKQNEKKESQSMRTTLTAFAVEGEKGYFAHIGDSRIYIFEGGEYKARTIDHSVVQILALAGEIEESKMRSHPDRNRLLRCLGDGYEVPRYDLEEITLKKGMAVLMCSDGFWEFITESQMQRELRSSRNVKDWVERMKRWIKREEKTREQDNYSAIGIWFE